MNPETLLDNAATTSQHRPLLDDPIVRGAILRSIHQWLELDETGDIDFLKHQLKQNPDFNM